MYILVLVTIILYMYVITSDYVTEIKACLQFMQLLHIFANYFYNGGNNNTCFTEKKIYHVFT